MSLGGAKRGNRILPHKLPVYGRGTGFVRIAA